MHRTSHVIFSSVLALAGARFSCAVSPAPDRIRKGPVASGVLYIDKIR